MHQGFQSHVNASVRNLFGLSAEMACRATLVRPAVKLSLFAKGLLHWIDEHWNRIVVRKLMLPLVPPIAADLLRFGTKGTA